jgi:hypothetical protein
MLRGGGLAMTATITTTQNRRASRRRAGKRTTKVSCHKGSLGLGANLAISLLDASETGVRLLVKAALEKGQEVEVSVQGAGQARPLKTPGRVIWCVATADGPFCVGIHLQKPIQYGDLLLISQFDG